MPRYFFLAKGKEMRYVIFELDGKITHNHTSLFNKEKETTSPSIIFIEGQHLGVLLPIAKDALLSADHTKRSRQRKFLELARLLRGLKLIPEKEGPMLLEKDK